MHTDLVIGLPLCIIPYNLFAHIFSPYISLTFHLHSLPHYYINNCVLVYYRMIISKMQKIVMFSEKNLVKVIVIKADKKKIKNNK